MRFKAFLLIILAVFAFAIPSKDALAQKSYNNCISANPLGLAFGLFNATYEGRLSARNSFTINANYWSLADWYAFGIGGSYRWYLTLIQDKKKPLEGLSVGPLVAVGFWKYSGSFYSYTGQTSFAIGGEAAYKWVFDGFAVEPIIRIAFNVMHNDYFSYNAFGLGCNLGYAW